MINIKELSVGNWIENTNGNTGKVIGITEQVEVIVRYSENSTCYSEPRVLEPIKITPEILEKNGWKFDGCYSNTIDSIGRMIEYYHFEGILRLYIDDKPYTTIGSWLMYIHQLQNALTLCGINKEIKL